MVNRGGEREGVANCGGEGGSGQPWERELKGRMVSCSGAGGGGRCGVVGGAISERSEQTEAPEKAEKTMFCF